VYPERKTTDKNVKIKLPQVEVFWYDGGLKPMMPDNWPAGRNMNDGGGGVILHGTKDKIICGCYGVRPWLLSGREPKVEKTIPRVKGSHEEDWIRACKESPESRVQTASPFSQAGPFNEMVVMGVLAVRLQGLEKELLWDGPKMEFTNIKNNEEVKFCLDTGLKIIDGNPRFNRQYTKPINAKEFAADLIKHNYRESWSLPAMP